MPLPALTESNTVSKLDLAHVTKEIDLLVALHLHLWNNLTYAIQNAWGGSPELSADKRDWLAGAISNLIVPDPETLESRLADPRALEQVLAQVMLDEFEVVLDDGSCQEVAENIWRGREKVLEGDFSEVQQLKKEWEKRKGEKVFFQKVEQKVDAQETDDDEDSDSSVEDGEWNGFADSDAEMAEAPPLVTTKKEKTEPEIDEDGFTKVVRKKK